MPCNCCCGDEQVHTEYDKTKMKCCTCGCTKDRETEQPSLGAIAIRVIVRGTVHLKVVEDAALLARTLGAEDNVALRRNGNNEHYLDVPAEGLINRLEIANLTKKTPVRSR